jgi:hypothetical protein
MVLRNKYLFLSFQYNTTHQFLNIDETSANCQVVQYAATVEHVWNYSNVQIGLLTHLPLVLFQQAKCILNHTSSTPVPFVIICLRRTTRLPIVLEGHHNPTQQGVTLIAEEVRCYPFLITSISAHEPTLHNLLPET